MASHADVARKAQRHTAEMARTAEAFVATPAGVAEELTGYPYAMIGGLPAGARVLEPSAGDGAIVWAILDANPDVHVTAVEPNLSRWNLTEDPRHVWVVRDTFEAYLAAHPSDRFDAVVMNPPFSLPGRPGVWLDHVLAAWELLRPGGRLVAVVPGSYTGDHPPPTPAGARLHDLAAAHGGVHRFTAAAFAAERVGRPSLVWLVRPVPTVDGRPSWLFGDDHADVAPVSVDELDTGPSGAELTPVQAYRDRWDGDRPRVVRFAGTCHACARLLWGHDDGIEDAQPWAANSCLEAVEFGLEGPTVGLCMECANDRESRERALEVARRIWTDVSPALTPTMLAPTVPAQQLTFPL